MNPPIVASSDPLGLVGGGDCSQADLLALAPHVSGWVAADGGAAVLLDHGIRPEAVIGDMDSLAPALRARLAPGQVHEIAEQDSTDFDKCLRSIAAPLVLAAGFLGARLDHQMAAQNTLLRHPDQPCLLLGAEDVVFVSPPELRLALAPGARVSLFPLGRVTGRSEGLDWPIDGLDFAPDGRVGTSNRSASGRVRLRFNTPAMLVILPRAALPAAIAGLRDAPARWPAR